MKCRRCEHVVEGYRFPRLAMQIHLLVRHGEVSS